MRSRSTIRRFAQTWDVDAQGFETTARIEVGKVIEFEFAQVVDENVRY